MKLQRYKPKIKQRLLLFLIAFVLSITAILMTQSPTLIYADSMTESETPGVGASDMGTGISYTRTGWLFYLTYPDGTEASPVKAAFSYDNRFMDTAGNPVNNRALITRMGTRYSDYDAMTINVSWGPPFDSNGNFRGDDVRNFFETDDNGDGHVRAYEFIQVNWDEEWANKWESKEVYLVFEPFYWARLIRDGKTTGYWWAGTSMRWGLVQHYMGINAEDEGDPISKRYTNDIYDNCVILSDCEEIREMGLNAPPHNRIVKNSESMTNDNGWGIGVLWHEPEGIHTYNRVDSPGDPETNDPPRNGTCSIVKGYYTEYKTGNTVTKLTNDGTFYTTMCTNEIFIDDEPEYQIERWNISSATNTSLQSTNGSTVTWNPPSRISESGTTSTVKTLTDTQKCVYVLLKRTIEEEAEPLDANYTLTQSSITRRIHFSNPDAQLSMVKMQNYNFKFLNPAHQTECAGHTYNCDGCQNNSCDCVLADGESCTKDHGKSCPGHTDKCTWGKWTDQTLKLSILNTQKSDYPDILATKQGWNFETQKGGLAKRADTKTRTIVGASSFSTSNWDYVCVIHRGKDKLTLADWINTGQGIPAATTAITDLSDTSSSGYAASNMDSGARKLEDYYEQFSAKFEKDSSDLYDYNTTRAVQTGTEHGSCDDSVKTTTLSSPLSVNVIVKVETYSGSPDGGLDDNTCGSGQMVPSGGTITFRPYVRMKYDTLTALDKTAYVLGEYQRSITPNDYAELKWNTSNPGILTLISSQWSTHADAVKDHGTDSVLPGGATLSLGIKKSNRQTVDAITWQTVIRDDGEGRTHIDNTGSDGGLTEAAARQAHESYVNTVISALENTCVEQFVDNNDTASDAFNGKAVHPGSDISFLNTGASTASTEDKYYLREDGTPSPTNEGDFDVNPSPTTTLYYTFTSDTSGNILMNGSIILTKGQDHTALSGLPQIIDSKTYVVRKLIKAIERNTGSDSTSVNVGDAHWYNEAVDGMFTIF